MKTHGSPQDPSALLASFVATLQGLLESDEALRSACAGMDQLGLAPLLRVELVAGAARPTVTCAERRAAVPQWSEQDAEVLRSVGIASDRTDPDPGPLQPRRREPR